MLAPLSLVLHARILNRSTTTFQGTERGMSSKRRSARRDSPYSSRSLSTAAKVPSPTGPRGGVRSIASRVSISVLLMRSDENRVPFDQPPLAHQAVGDERVAAD